MTEPAIAGGADPHALPSRGLLAIFAHPDDEAFGCGGTLALAAERHVPTWLVCATDGDQGGAPGEAVDDHSMDPEIRRGELRCACSAMGIAEPVFLGYRDSGMEGWGAPEGSLSRADPEEAIGRILAEIRRQRPAVVVTFDPGGIYGHPDHIAVSRFATEAYRRAARLPGGPSVLYHQALARSMVGDMQELMEELAARSGQPLPPPGPDDLRQREAMLRLSRPDDEISTVVDVRPAIERKLRALACHGSQMRGRAWGDVPRDLIDERFGAETFVRIDPAPTGVERETWLAGAS